MIAGQLHDLADAKPAANWPATPACGAFSCQRLLARSSRMCPVGRSALPHRDHGAKIHVAQNVHCTVNGVVLEVASADNDDRTWIDEAGRVHATTHRWIRANRDAVTRPVARRPPRRSTAVPNRTFNGSTCSRAIFRWVGTCANGCSRRLRPGTLDPLPPVGGSN